MFVFFCFFFVFFVFLFFFFCFFCMYNVDLWEDDLYVSALKRVASVWGFVNEKANGTLFG